MNSAVFDGLSALSLPTMDDSSVKPCFKHANGQCRLGNRCKYSHDTAAVYLTRGKTPPSSLSTRDATKHNQPRSSVAKQPAKSATRGDQSSSSYSAHTGNRNRANDQKKIDPPKKKTPYESDAMRKEDAAHQKVMDLLNDERVRAESLRQQEADIREDAKTERVTTLNQPSRQQSTSSQSKSTGNRRAPQQQKPGSFKKEKQGPSAATRQNLLDDDLARKESKAKEDAAEVLRVQQETTALVNLMRAEKHRAEAQAREEAARFELERLRQAEEARLAKKEAEDRAREEAEHVRQEEIKKAEEARMAKEAARVKEQERQKREKEARAKAERQRKAEQERRRQEDAKQERQRKAEQERQRQEEEEAAQRRERERKMEAEARETYQKVVSGSLVTFTAGLDVRHIVTGFESCKIVVKGLPHDIRPDEILTLLVEQGLDETQFFVVDVQRQGARGKQDVTIVAHNDAAEVLAERMDDLELRGEKVELEFGVFNGMGEMGAKQNDSGNLFVSFWAPSARYAVSYVDAQTMQAKIRQLNGRKVDGRYLQVVAGREANTVVINNLPVGIGRDRVKEVAATKQVKQLPSSIFEVDVAIRLLRDYITQWARGGDIRVDTISKGNDRCGSITLRVVCPSWDEAKSLHDVLEQYQPSDIGRTKLRLRLPDPMYYTIYIPPGQYRAQETIWTSLNDGIKDHRACRLIINRMEQDYRIQVAGRDKLAVGALKVRVENIAAGTVIPGWHPALERMHPALVQTIEDTQAFMKMDATKCRVKLYGTPRALEAATRIVMEEMERLNGAEQTIPVPLSAIRYFRQRGVQELKELLGDVVFNVARRTVVVKGGEQAKRHVQRLVEQSKQTVAAVVDVVAGELCPICYDSPTLPRTFQCGHVYCSNCLHHLFSSAGDDLPLVCMGDEARCRAPFPIAVMKEFLPLQAFDRLLDAAFSAHVDKRPREFQPCRTPDCGQIYRRQERELHCPSCFSEMCGACGEDVHAGVSCEVARVWGSKAEQETLSERYLQSTGDVKQCPVCERWMSKSSGCNHVACRCGAHVCWRCLGVFGSSQETYTHMRAEHGGIYYDPGPPLPPVAVVPVPAVVEHVARAVPPADAYVPVDPEAEKRRVSATTGNVKRMELQERRRVAEGLEAQNTKPHVARAVPPAVDHEAETRRISARIGILERDRMELEEARRRVTEEREAQKTKPVEEEGRCAIM